MINLYVELVDIMDLNGKVTSGYGKGCVFLSDEYYKKNINQKCRFTPYPGTLNIIIDDKYIGNIIKIKKQTEKRIDGNENHGSVKFVKAILEGSVHGAILFPDKTTHKENEIEFISEENLRSKFDLKDGDEVEITVYDI
ncbi:MAG: CTP-dependent riboflavin kinase [Methanobrevibacter sp.]|jgi:riboflavin kinase|nr:CTP-dependent riboflavin kinase [Candidatus Methanovirga australis]